MSDISSVVPEVSIIVPVYKVENYINQCLESIENQTFTNFECIIVNDGSPDNSADICSRFVSRDSRFHLINRDNGGLSAARNSGLEAAKGSFISFVDSDDWIEPDFLQTLLKVIKDNDADIAQVGFIREYKGTSRKKPLVNQLTQFSAKDALLELVKDNSIPSYVCNKLFRRDAIITLFPEGQTFEDIYVLTEWIEKTNKFVASPNTLYHYRMRGSSIMNNSACASNRLNFLKSCEHRAEILSSILPEDFNSKARNKYLITNAVAAAKTIARFENDPKSRKDAIKFISNKTRSVSLHDCKKLGIKKSFRARLLQSHPLLFSHLMKAVYTADLHAKNRRRLLYD